jgi:hypothetical protein
MMTVAIAFDADNPGRWAFRCHDVYRMDDRLPFRSIANTGPRFLMGNRRRLRPVPSNPVDRYWRARLAFAKNVRSKFDISSI